MYRALVILSSLAWLSLPVAAQETADASMRLAWGDTSGECFDIIDRCAAGCRALQPEASHDHCVLECLRTVACGRDFIRTLDRARARSRLPGGKLPDSQLPDDTLPDSALK